MKLLNLSELEIGYFVALKLRESAPCMARVLNINGIDDVDFELSNEYMVEYRSGNVEQIVAIPLTINWLSSLGFVRHFQKPNFFGLPIGGFLIEVEASTDGLIDKISVCENGVKYEKRYDYVHEMQQEISHLNLIVEYE
ncbi:MAG: hypothetical protein LBN93_01890 [Candidatus Symbiothrix sp.]|jgi:hypothetical protein|nr:hypothetical protein [Candidatus Symbiothrix sp.]